MSAPFAYYSRLNRRQKVVYQRSDTISHVGLPGAPALSPLVLRLAEALGRENRAFTQAAAERLLGELASMLEVPLPTVFVLATRPHARWGELHGLYTPARGNVPPRITVWMRTARRRQVVAFRTFLRTLLHEFCHHLDYRLLGLPDSFHTEGFYKRESSLFHQLTGGLAISSPGRNHELPRRGAPPPPRPSARVPGSLPPGVARAKPALGQNQTRPRRVIQ